MFVSMSPAVNTFQTHGIVLHVTHTEEDRLGSDQCNLVKSPARHESKVLSSGWHDQLYDVAEYQHPSKCLGQAREAQRQLRGNLLPVHDSTPSFSASAQAENKATDVPKHQVRRQSMKLLLEQELSLVQLWW